LVVKTLRRIVKDKYPSAWSLDCMLIGEAVLIVATVAVVAYLMYVMVYPTRF
jgi:K+-transporting ATPase ATPase F chain